MTEHVVRLGQSYYASLCWHGLRELGFMGGAPNPAYADQAAALADLGRAFGFRAPMAGGPLFRFVYQIPGYLNPQTPAALDAIMRASRSLLQTGVLDAFREGWPDQIRHWELWYHPTARAEIRTTFAGREATACAALDRWTDFMVHLWDRYRPIYDDKLVAYPFEAYAARCAALHAFDRWEADFGVAYPYTDFTLIICPESPTSASSLGPEQIVFGAAHPWAVMENAVIHEIGVRVPGLHRLAGAPETAEMMRQDEEGLIKLLETEICYRKRRMLPDLTADPFVKGMGLEGLMAWREQQDVDWAHLPGAFATLYDRAQNAGVL